MVVKKLGDILMLKSHLLKYNLNHTKQLKKGNIIHVPRGNVTRSCKFTDNTTANIQKLNRQTTKQQFTRNYTET